MKITNLLYLFLIVATSNILADIPLSTEETALFQAIKGGNINQVQNVLKSYELQLPNKGVLNEIRDKNNDPILITAVKTEKPAIVNLLLDREDYYKTNINPNVKDQSGMTPLHWAVKFVNPLIISKLLKKGANLNIQDQYGATPLIFATSMSVRKSPYLNNEKLQLLPGIVQMLIAAGTNVNLKNSDGKTAEDLVSEPGVKYPAAANIIKRFLEKAKKA